MARSTVLFSMLTSAVALGLMAFSWLRTKKSG